MMKDLKLTRRRKLLGAVVICVILITGSTMLWQMGQVVEAAVLYPHADSVGWWRFDEGSGTVAEDSSGHGNHGTIYGAAWVNGEYGKALSFDGTDDYVSIPHSPSLNLTDQITIAFWYTPFETEVMPVFKMQSFGGSKRGGYDIQLDANRRLIMHFGTDSLYDYLVSASALTLGTQYFVTFARSGSAMKIYINGILDKSGDATQSSWNSCTQNLQLAKGWSGNPYDGCVIDEVRIYNRALSADEIRENFEKGPDFSSRLLANVPKGTTQFIATLSWQGIGSIDATIESPSETYTEDMVPVYQKTVYSSGSGDMLNIKRIALSVTALVNDENWYIILELDNVEDYQITVEVQR